MIGKLLVNYNKWESNRLSSLLQPSIIGTVSSYRIIIEIAFTI